MKKVKNSYLSMKEVRRRNKLNVIKNIIILSLPLILSFIIILYEVLKN